MTDFIPFNVTIPWDVHLSHNVLYQLIHTPCREGPTKNYFLNNKTCEWFQGWGSIFNCCCQDGSKHFALKTFYYSMQKLSFLHNLRWWGMFPGQIHRQDSLRRQRWPYRTQLEKQHFGKDCAQRNQQKLTHFLQRSATNMHFFIFISEIFNQINFVFIINENLCISNASLNDINIQMSKNQQDNKHPLLLDDFIHQEFILKSVQKYTTLKWIWPT